jgi:hypothetical protein
MSRWLIHRNDTHTAVDSVDALRALAKRGELGPGDMIQPPGAADWLYASEIDTLADVLRPGAVDDDDAPARGALLTPALMGLLAVVFGGVILFGAGAIYWMATQIPAGATQIIGDGALNYSQVVATRDTPLLGAPEARAATARNLAKDEAVELLAKRGDFYKVRLADGAEGWVALADVLPTYRLGGGEVQAEMDPLFNPDRYLVVQNASWLQLDRKNEQLTVFQFMLKNQSRYPMTDLVLLASIKDSRGTVVERVEIPIEGEVPAWSTGMVGTLAPDAKDKGGARRLLTSAAFEDLVEGDPDLHLRHSAGVEVVMQTPEFTEASIDLLQVRAIPEAAP